MSDDDDFWGYHYDPMFDYDRDGRLDPTERILQDDFIFGESEENYSSGSLFGGGSYRRSYSRNKNKTWDEMSLAEKIAISILLGVVTLLCLIGIGVSIYSKVGGHIKAELGINKAYSESAAIAESYGLKDISWGRYYYIESDKEKKYPFGIMICDNFDDLSYEKMIKMTNEIDARMRELDINFILMHYVCRGDEYTVSGKEVCKNLVRVYLLGGAYVN